MVGMECKLCSKKFSNGKALGGHMRSHYATLPLPPKTPQRQELSEPLTESTSSLFSSDERESSVEKSFLSASYGLRENPKKSFRLVDPKFFDAGSVVVDKESEFESTRGRCKRAKRMSVEDDQEVTKKGSLQKPKEPLAELEMEEDVALCLLMLSRDVWRSSDELRMSQMTGKVYKCERCDKVFKSSQGLGSHRASHYKKIKNSFDAVCEHHEFRKPEIVVKEQVHECPFCDKIFRSAQALGGHKRSHYLASKFGGSLVGKNISDKFQDAPIDLNLPAAMEDEDEEFVSEQEVFSF
ncbi:hypothetical protein Pfo_025614 [Paulownia fortunei]|nr:hypothetical protein Pfo_025614 [Paulownia fortunei]